MNTKISKRGRRLGSSQYAKEDQELLERSYVYYKQGLPETTAVTRAVEEQDWTPLRKNQAVARLRRGKFKRFRAEKEKALLATHPTAQSGRSPLGDIHDQARQAVQAVKFLGPSGVKAIKEHERWRRENKDAIRQVVETMRSRRKRQT